MNLNVAIILDRTSTIKASIESQLLPVQAIAKNHKMRKCADKAYAALTKLEKLLEAECNILTTATNSSILMEQAKELGLQVVDLSLAKLDPESMKDIPDSGIPFFTKEGR